MEAARAGINGGCHLTCFGRRTILGLVLMLSAAMSSYLAVTGREENLV